MEVTARDIHEKQFHDAWRGYNQEEVDDFLDRVAETVDRLQRENSSLQARIRELDQVVAQSREAEDMLKKTLITAQQAAEEAISNAKSRADQLINEAEERTKKATAEAKERRSALEAEIRRRSQEADREHAGKKKEMEAVIDRMRAFETELKQKLRAALEQQRSAIDKHLRASAEQQRAFVEQQMKALTSLSDTPTRPSGRARVEERAAEQAVEEPAAPSDAHAPDVAVEEVEEPPPPVAVELEKPDEDLAEAADLDEEADLDEVHKELSDIASEPASITRRAARRDRQPEKSKLRGLFGREA